MAYKTVDDVIYFKAKDIATILGYRNTRHAITDHVDDEYKYRLKDILTGPEIGLLAGSDHQVIYVTEPGLYQLVFKSNMLIAKTFAKWVFSDVLPRIRTTGSYELPKTVSNQIVLRNEKDLHYKVVKFLRAKYPDIIFVPGLGEYQTTDELRIDAKCKGYSAGAPDILITSPHKNGQI